MLEHLGFPKIRGTFSGGPHDKDYDVLMVHIGVALFWETTILQGCKVTTSRSSGLEARSVALSLPRPASVVPCGFACGVGARVLMKATELRHSKVQQLL